MRICEIALNRAKMGLLTYILPDDLNGSIEPGMLVEVPFQRGKEIGCVVSVNEKPAGFKPKFRLRSINRRASPEYNISNDMLKLSEWISSYYSCTFGEAISTASMIGFSDISYKPEVNYRVREDYSKTNLTKRQREVWLLLKAHSQEIFTTKKDLVDAAGCSVAVINKLIELEALEEFFPSEVYTSQDNFGSKPVLFQEQEEVVNCVSEDLFNDAFSVNLLHGITGSGKTEVYLRLIENALTKGKTALCLVPEISLTPQTVQRFVRRFNQEIGVFHSHQTRNEKLELFLKIQRKQIRIVIGARSSVFMPLEDLGIIIVDEEHEGSYKQGENPRYHARDTAIMRGMMSNTPVILGSATPSLESYFNAKTGKYRLFELTSRPQGLSLPEVRIVPLIGEKTEQVTSGTLLSEPLKESLRQRLLKGEQSILFLNRRGFSSFLLCHKCKHVMRCHEDDIVMTIHRKNRRDRVAQEEQDDLFQSALKPEEAFLKCHFCGYTADYPKLCPECGEGEMTALGTGTQRVEEALAEEFPQASILRLDQDTVRGKYGFQSAWEKMNSGDVDIILGTQMIAKGLHLDRVTLVGVILADVGLFIPDFRSEERTFSLLTQVAGRAGRSDIGEVIFQTYMPDHSAIQNAAKHDYLTFYQQEIKRREKTGFPPVSKLTALTLSGKDFKEVKELAYTLTGVMRRLLHRREANTIKVLGPQPAPIEKLASRFRFRILLKAGSQSAIKNLLSESQRDKQWRITGNKNLTIDIDPIDLL